MKGDRGSRRQRECRWEEGGGRISHEGSTAIWEGDSEDRELERLASGSFWKLRLQVMETT